MAKRFLLSDKFSMDGAFWAPDNPNHKLLGRLAAKEKIEFRTAPAVQEANLPLVLPELTGDFPVNPALFHGFTQEGICTLLSLHYLSAPGLTDYTLGISVTAQRYRVDLCVFGLHVPSLQAEYIESAGFSLSSIHRWFAKADHVEI